MTFMNLRLTAGKTLACHTITTSVGVKLKQSITFVILATSVKVLEGLRDNMSYLTTATRNLRDAMYNSTLPWQVIDTAAGRISVPR